MQSQEEVTKLLGWRRGQEEVGGAPHRAAPKG